MSLWHSKRWEAQSKRIVRPFMGLSGVKHGCNRAWLANTQRKYYSEQKEGGLWRSTARNRGKWEEKVKILKAYMINQHYSNIFAGPNTPLDCVFRGAFMEWGQSVRPQNGVWDTSNFLTVSSYPLYLHIRKVEIIWTLLRTCFKVLISPFWICN